MTSLRDNAKGSLSERLLGPDESGETDADAAQSAAAREEALPVPQDARHSSMYVTHPIRTTPANDHVILSRPWTRRATVSTSTRVSPIDSSTNPWLQAARQAASRSQAHDDSEPDVMWNHDFGRPQSDQGTDRDDDGADDDDGGDEGRNTPPAPWYVTCFLCCIRCAMSS